MNVGAGMNLILTPLVVDMLYEANITEEHNPDVFGDAGTYALVYWFLCAAFGLAASVGPAWSDVCTKGSIGRPLWYHSLLFA